MRTLVIDTSSATLFVGAFEGGAWLRLLEEKGAAMEGIFEMVREIFETWPLNSFGRVALCEGPGRLMALRIAAVAGNQWAQSKAKAVFNSLQIASAAASEAAKKPVTAAYELRVGVVAHWSGGKVELSPSLPEGAVMLGSAVTREEDAELYAKAIEALPLHEEFLRGVEFFDPPMWAPSNYALAKTGVVSRDLNQEKLI